MNLLNKAIVPVVIFLLFALQSLAIPVWTEEPVNLQVVPGTTYTYQLQVSQTSEGALRYYAYDSPLNSIVLKDNNHHDSTYNGAGNAVVNGNDITGEDVMIRADNLDSDTLKLQFLKYRVNAQESHYVSEDSGLKQLVNSDNEGAFLTDAWDIDYRGLTGSHSAFLTFSPGGTHSYHFQFHNQQLVEFDVPLATMESGALKWGNSEDDFVFTEVNTDPSRWEDTFITEHDQIAISNSPAKDDDLAITRVLQYRSINTNLKTITFFKSPNGPFIDASYSGTPGVDAVGILGIDGTEHVFYVGGTTEPRYALSMDLDGDGEIIHKDSVSLVTFGGGIIDLPVQSFSNHSPLTQLAPIQVNITTKKDRFDESREDETSNILIWRTSSEDLSLNVSRVGGSPEGLIDTDAEYSTTLSGYGAQFYLYQFDEDRNPMLEILYSESQKEAEVFVKSNLKKFGQAGETPIINNSKEFRMGNDVLSMGEEVGDVKQTFTKSDLDALISSIFDTGRSQTPLQQYLKFGDSTMHVKHTMHDNIVAPFLIVPNNSQIFEYHLEFIEGAISDIDSDTHELEDLENEVVTIIGTPFMVSGSSINTLTNSVSLDLLGGQVSDVLRDGETKIYTIDGEDFEVTAVFVTSEGPNGTAKFSVNGIMTQEIDEGDIEGLSTGVFIGVQTVLTNNREALVEFVLGAKMLTFSDSNYADAAYSGQGSATFNGEDIALEDIIIRVDEIDSDTVVLHFIKYRLLAGEDYFVPTGTGVREAVEESNPGAFLTNTWDISYAGLVNTGTSEIQLIPVTNHSFSFNFQNLEGDEYTFPLVTATRTSPAFGDDDNNFIFEEMSSGTSPNSTNVFIRDDDYFVVSDMPSATTQDKAITNILRYQSINTESQTLTFQDLAGSDFVVSYSGVLGSTATGNLVVAGTTHTFYVGSDGSLMLDLDASGAITLGTQIFAVSMGGGIFDFGDQHKDGSTVSVDDRKMTLWTPASQFDEDAHGAERSNVTILYNMTSHTVDMSVSVDGVGDFVRDPEDANRRIGFTDYGALFVQQDHLNGAAPDLHILYPNTQKYAQVFVVANTTESEAPEDDSDEVILDDEAKFKTGNDILALNEEVGDVKQTFTANDLLALKSSIIENSEGDTPVKQYLKFGDTPMLVKHAKHPSTDDVAAFLYTNDNSQLFEYHLEFTEGIISSIDDDGQLPEIEGKIFHLLGLPHIISNAEVSGQSIEVTLNGLEITSNDFVSINDSTGLVEISPPAGFQGSFDMTFLVTDGFANIEKTITVEVAPEQAPPITPSSSGGSSGSRSRGGGGGGSSAPVNSTAGWTCSEWSACIDGRQEQTCTLNKGSKKNVQNCTFPTASNSGVVELAVLEPESVVFEESVDETTQSVESGQTANSTNSTRSGLEAVTGNVVLNESAEGASGKLLFLTLGALVLAAAGVGLYYLRKHKKGV